MLALSAKGDDFHHNHGLLIDHFHVHNDTFSLHLCTLAEVFKYIFGNCLENVKSHQTSTASCHEKMREKLDKQENCD